MKEKEAVQLNQIPISGISSHSASDDSYAGEKNLDSGTPNAADILRYLNDIMKKDGYCLNHKQKHDLPYAKHYEIAFVFPYSEDKLNVLPKSKLTTGIASMFQTSADSKVSKEYLGRTFARTMMGIHDPRAKSCEAALRIEEQ